MRRRPGWVLVAAFGLTGCVTVPADGSRVRVTKLVEQRSGVATSGEAGPLASEAVAARVAQLLDGGLTRERAAQVALLNNPSLRATYEELGVSQADMIQAGLLSNPTLSGSLGFPAGGGRVEYESSLVQDFLDLFVLPLRRRVAQEQLMADTLRVAHEALGIVAEVRERFARLQAKVQEVELSRRALQAEQASADFAGRLYRAGNITALALAREQAEYEEAKVRLSQEELEIDESRTALDRLLGLWGPQTGWELAEALPELPPEEVPLDGLEHTAIRQRLDVDAARKQALLMFNAVELARSTRLFGMVQVGVHVHQDQDGPRFFGPTLSLELPVFDRRQALIARLEAQRRQAEDRLVAVSVDVRSEVRLARARLIAVRQQVEHYRDVLLPLREKIVDQAQLQYNGMQLGLRDLLEVRRAQLEDQHAYVERLRDYWVARAELERVVGGRVGAPSTAPGEDGVEKPAAGSKDPEDAHGHHAS